MHSQKDMLFSKCPHNVECAKNWETDGQSFGKCWTWCAYDNGDPHVNNGRGKKIGDIFPALGGIEPGRNSYRVGSLGHWASSVLSLQRRHCLWWSDHLLHLCALAAAPLFAVVNMLNKRVESGDDCTWRGRQSGPTRSMAVRKQVPHWKNTSS